MRSLTAKEITDIIFQKPDRITAGVLDRLGFFKKCEMALARPKRQFEIAAYAPSSWDDYKFPLTSRLQLTFEQWSGAKKIENKDNSLLNAKKELKALGLSHKQIGFIFARLDTLRTEMIELQKSQLECRGMFFEDDHAFLGMRLQRRNKDSTFSGEAVIFYEAYPEFAESLYSIFQAHFTEEIENFPQAYAIKQIRCTLSPK